MQHHPDFLRDATKLRQSVPGDPLRWTKVRIISPKQHRTKTYSHSSNETNPPLQACCSATSVQK
jgi:hypothetical protein